jgi:hypothetical protein
VSKTGWKVTPLLPVFHSPPVAKPTKNVRASFASTAKSSTRPPWPDGPIERQRKPCSRGFVGALMTVEVSGR